ncbi:hypothetical protein phiOC_p223 [Ochrobactrum phage vB_OspM_OC]|nr:hypothetical protein phiOC_p223 [Ochrobactrum phage vB_OspM_OC]
MTDGCISIKDMVDNEIIKLPNVCSKIIESVMMTVRDSTGTSFKEIYEDCL